MTETELKNAAWYYPTPGDKAKNIKDHVAFCEYLSITRECFVEADACVRQEHCRCQDGMSRPVIGAN